MAKINNAQVIQKLVDELKLYPGQDVIPTELADKILPVFQVNSEQLTISNTPANVVKQATTTGGTGANTIYTVPATGKFYLTAYTLTSAGGAGTNDHIEITVDGVAIDIALLDNAGGHIAIALNNPVLLDPGTDIELWNGLPADVHAMAMGYTEVD